jgi:hypothetical protein
MAPPQTRAQRARAAAAAPPSASPLSRRPGMAGCRFRAAAAAAAAAARAAAPMAAPVVAPPAPPVAPPAPPAASIAARVAAALPLVARESAAAAAIRRLPVLQVPMRQVT